MKKTENIFTLLLLVCCYLTIGLTARYIAVQDKWSPIDEYAHFDYIEKLTSGHFPRLSDSISEEIYQHIKNKPEMSVAGMSQSREELGLGNFSYQAKHPPFYFLVLSIPEWLMQKMNIEVFQRLKFLRLFSYFLFVIGMFMCIPVFNALRQLGYEIPRWYGTGCVLFGLIIFSHQRYGLGNNALSPLLINSAVLFLLKYWLETKNKDLYLFLAFCGMSLLTALTNIFIVPFLFLLILVKYKRYFTSHSLIISCGIVLLTGLAFLVWRQNSTPDKDFEAFIQTVLLMTIPAGVLHYAQFLDLLLEDTFTLNFMSDHLDVSRWIIYLIFVNGLTGVFLWKSILRKHLWVLVMLVFFCLFLMITFTMNKYIPRVTWVAFRHYLAFIPVIYVASTAFIPVLLAKFKGRA